ncbi:CoA transferase subunit A [Telmatospirillum siberiense]|uniref:CoA synthetase n=1 Tax=Telmatospirillum siberiense TaxID=382514 RepID=A0A2N3PP10_9PROT|nr:CoA-transferase [Telmatospirillum siberiense]PKU22128.1 CoA synthetase [Telmatospirillum siberiense]
MRDPGPVSVNALAGSIPDGARLALPADYGGVAMAATFALIRRGARRLRLFGVPTSGLQTDLLIGAGAVETLETAGMALGESGVGPRFRDALRAGGLVVRDSTCPAQHAALQAGEKGIPFLPLRGILGTDLLAGRQDWPVIRNPLAGEADPDPIVLIPAVRPDVALFHAALADAAGNVWIGLRRELATLAHAARRTLVTVEALHPGNLLEDPLMAPGTLPHLYVAQVAVAPGGSWPLAFGESHPADDGALARYSEAAKTDDGFAAILAEWLR